MSCQKPDKPANPALHQENNKNLQALIAAREAQDAKWSFKPNAFGGDQGLTNPNQKK